MMFSNKNISEQTICVLDMYVQKSGQKA